MNPPVGDAPQIGGMKPSAGVSGSFYIGLRESSNTLRNEPAAEGDRPIGVPEFGDLDLTRPPSGTGVDPESWLGELLIDYGLPLSGNPNLGAVSRQWLRELEGLTLVQTQQRMWVLGMYPGESKPDWGRIKPQDVDAVEKFFGYALTDPDTDPFQQLLDFSAGDAMFPGDESAAGAAMSVDPIKQVLDNPADLERIIDQAYRSSLGRAATDADKRAFVVAFHAFQRDAYMADARFAAQAEDATGAEGSDRQTIETVAPQSAEGFVEQYVENADPTAFAGEQVIDTLGSLSDNLGRA